MIRTTLLAGAALLLAVGAQANTEPRLYGLHEKVRLPDLALELPAKLDTGAVTASLSARDIELFERDGEGWVRFRLAVDGEHADRAVEKPLVRISQIKRRAADRAPGDERAFTRRPVVAMDICLGDERREIEVNLTDRSDFDYPLLIGSTVLRELDAAVAPGLRHAAGDPLC